MKLLNFETRRENIRFINPQFFGNCSIYQILTVHFDNLDSKSLNPVERRMAIENLELTYGRSLVNKFREEFRR